MNIKMKSLILVTLLFTGIYGISLIGIGAPAVATEYPPLPFLVVKNPTATSYDVWLMGEAEGDLDPYWDIIGFDIYLRFNPSARAMTVTIDPTGWWTSFWPNGIKIVEITIDNTEGFVRAVFVGLSGPNGAHTPPNGKGILFNVSFRFSPTPAEVRLKNPDPRPEMLPLWGPEYFRVAVAGVAHEERAEAPWNNHPWSVPIPHVTVPAVIRISASTTTPNTETPVTFNVLGPTWMIASYAWDFESDGIVDAYGVPATYTYPLRGFHIVTLAYTDLYGGTGSDTLLMSVKPLHRAWPEHHVFDISDDEDGLNTLFAEIKNQGAASSVVKAVFIVYDRKTGMEIASSSAEGTVAPHSYLELHADFLPPETDAKYQASASLFYLDEAGDWIPTGTFPILFKVVP